MKIFLRFCGGFNALALIMLILWAAIALPTFGMWFYRWQFSQIGSDGMTTYERVQMQPEHLHEVTLHMIRYMQGRLPGQYQEFGADRNFIHEMDPALQIDTIVAGQPRPFFSDIEIRHMFDVYELFRYGYIIRDIMLIILLVTTVSFLLFGRDERSILFKSWQYGSAIVAGMLGALAIAIAINWRRAFHIFHEIFFSNDEWILDARVDLLVNIVPYPFFEAISAFIGIFFGLGLIIMFVAGKLLARRGRKFSRRF